MQVNIPFQCKIQSSPNFTACFSLKKGQDGAIVMAAQFMDYKSWGWREGVGVGELKNIIVPTPLWVHLSLLWHCKKHCQFPKLDAVCWNSNVHGNFKTSFSGAGYKKKKKKKKEEEKEEDEACGGVGGEERPPTPMCYP